MLKGMAKSSQALKRCVSSFRVRHRKNELEDGAQGSRIRKEYLFGKTLGEGASCTVKTAIHRERFSSYAIKIVHLGTFSEAQAAMLRQEVEILSRMDHPNVVKLYEVIEEDGKLYLLMELLKGGNLFERLVDHDAAFSEGAAGLTEQV